MTSIDFATPVLKRPHLVLSLLFLCAVLGFIGFRAMPMNLFPDANYPQIIVLVSEPGASAGDIEDQVTRPIEKALYSISLVRSVKSTSQDEMAAVAVEFEYEKGLSEAATDVANTLKRIEATLPDDILPPQIFKISDATAPVFTLALTPSEGSSLDLAKIRQLADNELKEALLNIPGVGDVEVFGSYIPEISIEVDQSLLQDWGITLDQVLLAVKTQNIDIPDGLIIQTEDQYRLKTYGQKKDISALSSIVIANRNGNPILLKDIANIKLAIRDRHSLFRGNGQEAIGINILRPDKNGHVTTTIEAFEKALPQIKARFPDISFSVADTQKTLIKTSIKNMAEALRDSVLMTVLVIFLTLASIRLASLAAISIPLVCFMAFAGMYLLGYELNIVTMTAIILSVGLLVDDSIVVIENIQRHATQKQKSIKEAVVDGLNEILLADWSGTFTTVIVLVPIMFVGGYSEKILRPLTVVLSLTLLSSFIVSVTIIPLFAQKLLTGRTEKNWLEKIAALTDKFIVVPLRNLFEHLVLIGLRYRILFVIVGIILFAVSMRQMPLIGRDLMPSMDTGIVKVSFKSESDASFDTSAKVAQAVENVLKQVEGLEMTSLVLGSEPGIVSFGTGRTQQHGIITAHYIDRFHRKESIWQIEQQIREKALMIPGITSLSVYDFGATPLSSIAAPVDIMVSGPDPQVLDLLAEDIKNRLLKVKGLTSVERSWTWDKRELALFIDPAKCAQYGTNMSEVSRQLRMALDGINASVLRVQGQDGYTLKIRFKKELRDNINDLASIYIETPKGPIPLDELAYIKKTFTRDIFTRKDLMPVVDIYGYRAQAAISHLHERIVKALAGLHLPDGYRMSYEGEYKNMGLTGKRLGKALGISLILLFFSLAITFRSFVNPFVIMVAIPLSIIGAIWGMLITGRHMCMPATMGLILLTGIVVNNSILLIDFIEQALLRGTPLKEAIVGAVRTRTRPIFMTVACTIVGMWPVAAQKALGLERLSPLAVVAIGGLLVSTMLTLVYVPIFYSLVADAQALARRAKRLFSSND